MEALSPCALSTAPRCAALCCAGGARGRAGRGMQLGCAVSMPGNWDWDGQGAELGRRAGGEELEQSCISPMEKGHSSWDAQ